MSRAKSLFLALCCLMGTSSVSAQTVGAALWKRVPSFPVSCYTDGEGFAKQVDDAVEALGADAARQQKANQATDDQVKGMSDAAKQSALMNYMTRNGVRAATDMQDMATGGEKLAQMEAIVVARRAALDSSWKAIEALYQKELNPVTDLRTAYLVEFEPGGNEARARTLMAQFNTAYERFCRRWFLSSNTTQLAASGPRTQVVASPFLNHLADLRQHLEQEAIPFHEENARLVKLQYPMWGIPATDYASPEPYNLVQGYLRVMKEIFGHRREKPATGA
jgi:hypothetical protein